jgi:hypothetical protein
MCGYTFATQEELSKHLIDADDGLGTAHGPGAQDPTGTRPERHSRGTRSRGN